MFDAFDKTVIQQGKNITKGVGQGGNVLIKNMKHNMVTKGIESIGNTVINIFDDEDENTNQNLSFKSAS